MNSNRYLRRILIACVIALPGRALHAAVDASADQPIVAGLVTQLASDSVDERNKAGWRLETFPPADLPLIESAAGQKNLAPDTTFRLQQIATYIKARVAKRQRQIDADLELRPVESKAALAAYQAGRHGNPKWDDTARAALTAWAVVPQTAGTAATHEAEINTAFAAALAAGCDDPGVLLFAGRQSDDPLSKASEQLFIRAEKSVDKSDDPLIRFEIAGRRIENISNHVYQPFEANVTASLDTENDAMRVAYDQLTAPQSHCPADLHLALCMEMFDVLFKNNAHARYQFDVKKVYDETGPALEAALPGDARVAMLKGEAYAEGAFHARGGNAAQNTSREQFEAMAAVLQTAEQSLTDAYHKDPSLPGTPVAMLKVILGKEPDNQVMETWYQRAIDLDPDSVSAVNQKMLYLSPQWHGSAEEMISFGRELAAKSPASSPLPLQLPRAYRALASRSGRAAEMYAQPQVWQDVSPVFEAYLHRYPQNNAALSEYAMFAWRCRHWDRAAALFKQLGDDVDAKFFGSEEAVKRAKADVAGQ